MPFGKRLRPNLNFRIGAQAELDELPEHALLKIINIPGAVSYTHLTLPTTPYV